MDKFISLGYIDPGSGMVIAGIGGGLLAILAAFFSFFLIFFKKIFNFFRKHKRPIAIISLISIIAALVVIGVVMNKGRSKFDERLAILGFDNPDRRMEVESLHPGMELTQVRENTGFKLLVKKDVATTEPPDDETLRILRNEVDPHRYIIGR